MTITPMPALIAKAICAIMLDIKQLEKDQENKHGGYFFAGIDAFLEMTRPLCAKHGLIIFQDEERIEVQKPEGKTSSGKERDAVLAIDYSFLLIHASGATWMHPGKRSVAVAASMGSQAYGAAQSYALKEYMRSLLQISTGEPEPDQFGQVELVSRPRGAWLDTTPYIDMLVGSKTLPDLENAWRQALGQRQNIARESFEDVIVAKDKRKAELSPPEPPKVDPKASLDATFGADPAAPAAAPSAAEAEADDIFGSAPAAPASTNRGGK